MAEGTPDLLGQAVGPIIAQLGMREQRVLLAVLERQAAETYRRLAAEAPGPEAREELMRAADNEEGIADVLEALDPGHERMERELWARFPELDGLFGSVLDGRPYDERLRLQRAAELGAADLFRSLADAEPDAEARQKLLDCANTEKTNAAILGDQLG